MTNQSSLMLPLWFLCAPLILLWCLAWNNGKLARNIKPVLSLSCLLAYFWWRVNFTILPYQHNPDVYAFWMWLVLVIEVFSYFEMYFLLLIKDSPIDRSKELDLLISTNPEYSPSVDLLIPTFNEPMDILERTLVRATHINYPNYSVFVLDDGRRPELQKLCEELGAHYMVRPDNSHAKAGNMNHALQYLNADILAILDADFAAHDSFLCRAVHFFKDPKIAQVQMPQGLFNYDRIQVNSNRYGRIRDEQWLWFNRILVKRDALDCATSCGSCSLVRRDALRTIGDRFPVETVTEDYDLSLRFMEKGLITRYLNEVHAVGLAAENMAGFFVQRKRWGIGNIKAGWLALKRARGLALVRLLLVFDWRYLLGLPARSIMFLVPILYFWFDLVPLKAMSIVEVAAFHGSFLALSYYAEKQQDRHGAVELLHSQATCALVALGFVYSLTAQAVSFKKLGFEVTPKGDLAKGQQSRGLIILLNLLIAGTLSGAIFLFAKTGSNGTLDTTPIVAVGWGIWNVIVLTKARKFAVEKKQFRKSERFHNANYIDASLTNPNCSSRVLENVSPLLDISEEGFRVEGDFEPGDYCVTFSGATESFHCKLINSRQEANTTSAFEITHNTLSRRSMHKFLYSGQFSLL